jgi:hypothetical protein
VPAERAIDREVRIDEGHWLSIGRLGAAGGIVLTAVREAGGAPRYGVEGSGKQAERLKSDERQNNRPRKGALGEESWGEAPQELVPGAEWLVAQQGSESPAKDEQLIEEAGERRNCKPALAGVEANQGSAGVGRMTVQRLREFLKQRWRAVREELLRGTDKPQQGGGRTVGIPRELDRFLQPAVMQSLQRKWASSRADGSPSGRIGAEISGRRLPLGGGLGVGEILGPSQPRQTEGEDRPTDERSAKAEAHSDFSYGWWEGRRIREIGG